MIGEFAAAKVNLYLHVTGRRPDGYHLLDSLMVSVGIGDRLEFSSADELRLTVTGPQAVRLQQDGGENIILRAARELAQLTGRPALASIHLEKVLPVASGIGGGSSDAAAALRGLCRLWQVQPSAEELSALALRLGADVPFCLHGRPRVVTGIGEQMDAAVALPSAYLVLVNPGRSLSTPSVFRAREGAFRPAQPFTGCWTDARHLADALRERHNDLTGAACGLLPEIAHVLDALSALPEVLLWRMSGSGATCFGLFAAWDAAERAAGQIGREHPDWWCCAAPLLV